MTANRAGIGGLVAALVLAVALVGCGNDGNGRDPAGDGRPPSAGEPHLPPFQLPPEFRDCMADEGIDIPASGDLPAGVDPAQFEQALQACGEFLHG